MKSPAEGSWSWRWDQNPRRGEPPPKRGPPANRMNAWAYHQNAKGYLVGEHRTWDGAEFKEFWEKKKVEEGADQ